MSYPQVSIIMSVYNGAADVPKAIDSILSQTFADFELIAINDGSFEDDTRAVLDGLAANLGDPRIRVVHLDENIGLAGALNHGMGLARGRYIARQDHDDISLPTRLERQVVFMKENPRCGLLGTAAEIWVGNASSGRYHDHPTDNATLQVDLLSNNPFVHTSILMRREAIERCGLYTRDPARQPPEDYELWSRIARVFEVRNLPERLVVYREVAGSISRDAANPFLDRLLIISAENIAHWNGIGPLDRHCMAAAALLHAAYDRVQSGTEIDPIIKVLLGAVTAIERMNPTSDLSQRKEQLLANARHRYVRGCILPGWAKPLVPIAGWLPLPACLKQHLSGWLAR